MFKRKIRVFKRNISIQFAFSSIITSADTLDVEKSAVTP